MDTELPRVDGEHTADAVGWTAAAPPRDLKPVSRDYAPVQEQDESTWQDVMDFFGFEAAVAGRFVTRTKGEQKIFLISEGMERFLRSETKMPTRLVLCGVSVLKRSNSYHERACPWQLDQQGVLSALALGMKRRLTASSSFLVQLLREREIPVAQVREAATAGFVSGLDALGSDDLRPGSLAVALEGTPCLLAVAAMLSDGMLELAVGSAAEASALLEELEGQPPVAEILRVPVEDGNSDASAGLDADDEAVEGNSLTEAGAEAVPS